MAHIPDGVLAAPVLITGAVATLAGCGYGLKRLEPERIPQAAVLSAVLFVASLVHFPVGPTSVHLILNGLAGVLLGWTAFPAIMVALLLQAVLFGFGGLVVLGVNAMNLAVPAVLCGLLFRVVTRRAGGRAIPLAAGAAGGLAVLLTAVMVSLSLACSGREFESAARLVVVAHLPVMVIESVFTAAAVGLLARLRPEFPGAAALAALLWLAVPGAAEAHKLRAFATVEGTTIVGYAYFSPGGRAQRAMVTVTAPDGTEIARLPTDDDGAFRFETTGQSVFRIAVDGGDGHVATYTVHAAEPPDPAPGAPVAGSGGAPAADTLRADTLRADLDRSLARQIRPLREQLDAYQEAVWMHDVLGGLGVIFGLGGVGYGLAQRRRLSALEGERK